MEQIKKDICENKWFRLEFIIIAIYSFVAGSVLILLPKNLMSSFGLGDASVCFYSIQSGVMLCILAIGYLMIGLKYVNDQGMVLLALVIKFIGAIFLFICYFVIIEAWILLVSSMVDFIMGLAIFWHYMNISLDFSDLKFDVFDTDINYFWYEKQ